MERRHSRQITLELIHTHLRCKREVKEQRKRWINSMYTVHHDSPKTLSLARGYRLSHKIPIVQSSLEGYTTQTSPTSTFPNIPSPLFTTPSQHKAQQMIHNCLKRDPTGISRSKPSKNKHTNMYNMLRRTKTHITPPTTKQCSSSSSEVKERRNGCVRQTGFATLKQQADAARLANHRVRFGPICGKLRFQGRAGDRRIRGK